jgi:hypothetical protein
MGTAFLGGLTLSYGAASVAAPPGQPPTDPLRQASPEHTPRHSNLLVRHLPTYKPKASFRELHRLSQLEYCGSIDRQPTWQIRAMVIQ